MLKKNIITPLLLSFVLSTFIFLGCGGGSSDEPNNPTQRITISGDYQVVDLGTRNRVDVTVALGSSTKSLYLVLSNNSSSQSTVPTISHNAKVTKIANRKSISLVQTNNKPLVLHAPQYIQEFNQHAKNLLTKTKNNQALAKTISAPQRKDDVVGESKIFYLSTDRSKSTSATARKVVSNIQTNIGTKTLNIWVSDDSFGAGCQKVKCVTQDMVDALASTFLKSGLDNDIYDWVSNIYGSEWGADTNGYSNLIGNSNEITILLTDIDNDNSATGGVVGFFWSKDNFNKSAMSGSNERIMFYADSVMFANGDGGTWSINDVWPKEMVSTLAHEFQHMINFYQKSILLDADLDVWINEMLSETTEDIVATKIHSRGPRGVVYTDGSAGEAHNTHGRYPLFNTNNQLSLTSWNNQLADYSKVNAFGAYLIRNYGGAKLLHDIVHNGYGDEQSIMDAVHKTVQGEGKTFDDLLSQWGVAVMLSDHDNLGDVPTYNTGDFTYSGFNGMSYAMGSVNFFNYAPLPTIYTSTGTIEPQGNYYYSIGENLTGDVVLHLELDGNTEVKLIAK